MLSHAILTIEHSNGEWLAIPVTNFPTLPEGSEIDINIDEDHYYESGKIISYRASNESGTSVVVEFFGNRSGDNSKEADEAWESLSKICVNDVTNYYDFILPQTLDYGVSFTSLRK